ncbi:MAG: DUF192 domain-containing protein [archaeon]
MKPRICRTFFSKLRGKMFSFSEEPLLFVFDKERKISLHTFFCFMPLEIKWLDRNMKVTKKILMKPCSFAAGYGKYVLEVPIEI